MTRDTVTVPREAWAEVRHFVECRATDSGTTRDLLNRIDVAAPSSDPEGGARGVQTSIATKQESRPEGAPRTETATAIYSVLSSACIEHSALSVSGFNLFGDSKSIKAAQEWLHSHSQIGDLKTNLRHWRDECGKLHAQLTKTPSADHDAGNLRTTGGEV